MKNVPQLRAMYKNPVKPGNRQQILNSSKAAEILRATFIDDVTGESTIEICETFKVLMLNRKNEVLGYADIAVGGLSCTTVDIKKIFQFALLANCNSIILCHNHPSGNLNPSQPDLKITKKIKLAGEYLDIKVLDHFILTSESYTSFADEGYL